jgi:hypothetical protein
MQTRSVAVGDHLSFDPLRPRTLTVDNGLESTLEAGARAHQGG